MKIIGIEVAKSGVLTCCLENIPSDIRKHARSYKPVTYKPVREDLEKLASSGDIFVIEPTGVYSRIWYDFLKRAGKDVRKVSPKRITHLRRDHGIESKTDKYDAFFLALFGVLRHANKSEFLSDHAEDLRDLILSRQSLTRNTVRLVNQIWRNLAYEWPEIQFSKSGTSAKYSRKFLVESPPAIFRYLADRQVTGKARRDRQLADTVGSGVSDLTRLLACQVCDFERFQYEIECQIQRLLESKEFAPYHQIFDVYGFGPLTSAVVLSRIFPIERYLSADNRPIIERVPGRYGQRSKRYVSLGAFKLSLGMGTVIAQSGTSEDEKPGGATYARSALFQHCKTKIVMSPPKDGYEFRRMEHRKLYETLATTGVKHHRVLMKVSARITKDLFSDLVAII